MQINCHSFLWSYLPRVLIFLAITVYIYMYVYIRSNVFVWYFCRQWLLLKDSAIPFWSGLHLPWVDWVQALLITERRWSHWLPRPLPTHHKSWLTNHLKAGRKWSMKWCEMPMTIVLRYEAPRAEISLLYIFIYTYMPLHFTSVLPFVLF